MEKTIAQIHQAVSEPIADLSTYRALPTHTLKSLDPFLLINHHGYQEYPPDNNGLPFGPHPHKGFETLTFVFAGSIAHQDSTGRSFITGPGGVQWMTAGSGIVHSEISPPAFLQDGGPLEIIQVWMNLPAKLKLSSPWYKGLDAEDLLHLEDDGNQWQWHITSGEVEGESGPIESMTGLFMSSLEILEGGRFDVFVPEDRQVMLYQVRGNSMVNGAPLDARQIIEFRPTGEEIIIEAQTDSLFLFCHGEPINEPVVSYGPFVMNTEAEIHEAIDQYQRGEFGNITS